MTIKKAKMARNSNPRPERVAAHLVGLSAESRAAAYLVAKGYRIVARRFRSPVGEVDIVARRRSVRGRRLARRASRGCQKRHQI
jgi:putative endonuclease